MSDKETIIEKIRDAFSENGESLKRHLMEQDEFLATIKDNK